LPARRSTQLQKSVGDVWSRISSANALQKERSGSSERGPSSGRRSAGDTVGKRLARNVRRESASPVKTGEVRQKTQGGERSPSSASSSPKAVRRSRDRGCNGHRILRRAPTDGRHPGSFMRRRLSRAGTTGGLGGLRILRPVRNLPKEGRPARWQRPRRGTRREGGTRIATGVSEARSHQRRGKKTPTLESEGREARSSRASRSMTIRRSGHGRRETSGPPVIPHGALVSVGSPRGESCGRSRERARCGYT
jgi:hypothetical protein